MTLLAKKNSSFNYSCVAPYSPKCLKKDVKFVCHQRFGPCCGCKRTIPLKLTHLHKHAFVCGSSSQCYKNGFFISNKKHITFIKIVLKMDNENNIM